MPSLKEFATYVGSALVGMAILNRLAPGIAKQVGLSGVTPVKVPSTTGGQ
jgi:hypothetical protein